MLDVLSQFDALGLGAIAGSLLFLAGLIWVLVDNSSFEETSRRHAASAAPAEPRRAVAAAASFPAAPVAAAALTGDPAPASPAPTAAAQPADADGVVPPDPRRGGGRPVRPGRPVRTRRAA